MQRDTVPVLPSLAPSSSVNDTIRDVNEGLKPEKQVRTIFTGRQFQRLEGEFNKNNYLTPLQRIELAAELQLTIKQVTLWFQNRATIHQRQMTSPDTSSASSKSYDFNNSSYDDRKTSPGNGVSRSFIPTWLMDDRIDLLYDYADFYALMKGNVGYEPL